MPMIKSPTAWMLRQDGEAFPVIQHLYGSLECVEETLYAGEWLYKHTSIPTTQQLVLRQHRTIAEASAVESPIRQETIGFPAHFFARAHNFKPPGRACQPEADSPMRT